MLPVVMISRFQRLDAGPSTICPTMTMRPLKEWKSWPFGMVMSSRSAYEIWRWLRYAQKPRLLEVPHLLYNHLLKHPNLPSSAPWNSAYKGSRVPPPFAAGFRFESHAEPTDLLGRVGCAACSFHATLQPSSKLLSRDAGSGCHGPATPQEVVTDPTKRVTTACRKELVTARWKEVVTGRRKDSLPHQVKIIVPPASCGRAPCRTRWTSDAPSAGVAQATCQDVAGRRRTNKRRMAGPSFALSLAMPGLVAGLRMP